MTHTPEQVELVARALARRGEFEERFEGSARALLDALRPMIEAQVREACAKVADGFNDWSYVQIDHASGEWSPGSPYDRGQQSAAKTIAAAIRERAKA